MSWTFCQPQERISGQKFRSFQKLKVYFTGSSTLALHISSLPPSSSTSQLLLNNSARRLRSCERPVHPEQQAIHACKACRLTRVPTSFIAPVAQYLVCPIGSLEHSFRDLEFTLEPHFPRIHHLQNMTFLMCPSGQVAMGTSTKCWSPLRSLQPQH